jgi:hypothetical protein
LDLESAFCYWEGELPEKLGALEGLQEVGVVSEVVRRKSELRPNEEEHV